MDAPARHRAGICAPAGCAGPVAAAGSGGPDRASNPAARWRPAPERAFDADPESETEWVTHEAVISKDETAIAIMGHRKIPNFPREVAAGTPVSGANPGQEAAWGPSGTREKPMGLGIVNFRTREMVIVGQTPSGSGLWHVSGSPDGRWAVGDDFARNIYLIDRHTHEMLLLSAGHKETAADHPHPTMSPDGMRIEIQSAMLYADDKSLNICIIPVPEAWLKRVYK